MEIELGFGDCPQTVAVPDENLLAVLAPNEVPVPLRGEAAVAAALQNPVGTPRLGDLVRPGEKIAIVTSDHTRPLPSAQILPALLRELQGAGILLDDVIVVFALGCHRRQTPDEMRKLVGNAVYDAVRCIDSDPDDCVHLGITAMGTPVDITRAVAHADRRIALGNIEYHYFAGYSGGAKAIMPGVSTRRAIQNNHSRMVLPEASVGRLDGNPIREDMEEVLNFCPLDFIINVVLDEHKDIIRAVAGHAVQAHRQGCTFLDSLYKIKLPQKADIVIASQGGAPKDLDLYQTQKALENAKYAVKDGGIIILVGSCREGLGEEVFERWMTTSANAKEMIRHIACNFELGGHKAAAIAMVLEKAQVWLVSEMDPAFVETIFLRPFYTVQTALNTAFAGRKDATVVVMPYAGSTFPVVEGG